MTIKECIFCGISRGAVEADILYRDEQLMVFKDANPEAPTHLLIIPRRHVAGLSYAGGRTAGVLGQMFGLAEEMARREGVTISGYRLVMNQGPDSGQELEHLHMHLMGGKTLGAMG
jgi:histidine triad (HIT) family protein